MGGRRDSDRPDCRYDDLRPGVHLAAPPVFLGAVNHHRMLAQKPLCLPAGADGPDFFKQLPNSNKFFAGCQRDDLIDQRPPPHFLTDIPEKSLHYYYTFFRQGKQLNSLFTGNFRRLFA
jgi:hypothetical protein